MSKLLLPIKFGFWTLRGLGRITFVSGSLPVTLPPFEWLTSMAFVAFATSHRFYRTGAACHKEKVENRGAADHLGAHTTGGRRRRLFIMVAAIGRGSSFPERFQYPLAPAPRLVLTR